MIVVFEGVFLASVRENSFELEICKISCNIFVYFVIGCERLVYYTG